MYKTVFLVGEDGNSKTFNSLNTYNLSSKRVSHNDRLGIIKDINEKSRHNINFSFSAGMFEIPAPNHIYLLEHNSYKKDILMPKNPKPLDWVLLYYEQTTTIFKVSEDIKTKLTIYGNGQRMMGYDEPLYCDMEFLSLRLTFINDIDGWIVV